MELINFTEYIFISCCLSLVTVDWARHWNWTASPTGSLHLQWTHWQVRKWMADNSPCYNVDMMMLANTSLTRVLYYPTSLVKHPNNEYEYTVIYCTVQNRFFNRFGETMATTWCINSWTNDCLFSWRNLIDRLFFQPIKILHHTSSREWRGLRLYSSIENEPPTAPY